MSKSQLQERILIVDDDESTCKMLKLTLNKKGFETDTVGTGSEAIEKVKEKYFNLALLDLRLPDMSGTELIAPLKEINPDMALAIITAYASIESATYAVCEDASFYITKPVNIEEVIKTMKENVGKIQSLLQGVIPQLAAEECQCDCAAAAAEAEM